MTLDYRSNDAIITICQNNSAKTIEITNVNKSCDDVLGYASGELMYKSVYSILPPRIGELLKEYVEFEEDANDVGAVLAKVQSFSVIGKEGRELGYRLKVIRTESSGSTSYFQLVLQDKTGLNKAEALRNFIKESFKKHESLDPEFGLPDRDSLGRDIELMGQYSNNNPFQSCFAILQVDHYDELFSQYGRPNCIALMKHIAAICHQNLRPGDQVGIVSYKRVGVVMLDTTPKSALMVSNRLRWQIAANPFTLPGKNMVGISISVSFSRISGYDSDKTLIDDCDAALDKVGANTANALIEVDETSKRRNRV